MSQLNASSSPVVRRASALAVGRAHVSIMGNSNGNASLLRRPYPGQWPNTPRQLDVVSHRYSSAGAGAMTRRAGVERAAWSAQAEDDEVMGEPRLVIEPIAYHGESQAGVEI